MGDYLINIALSNGDIFARKYDTLAQALAAFDKLAKNPLVLLASVHDEADSELAIIDHCKR